MINNKQIASLLLSVFFVAGYAQDNTSKKDSLKTKNIEQVVVSATRSEQKISNLPIQVQVISKDEIEKINTVRLCDLLNEQTGLVSVKGYAGEGIQMQGFDSEYTLIMIDGVPLVGRTAGVLDLNRISIGNVERIEIVKGASSSLYGNEALGGVVNIITKTPNKGISTGLNYKLATFNTHDLSADVNFKKNKLSITSFANYNSSDGYDFDKETKGKTIEPFHSVTLSTKATYSFQPKNKLTVSARFYSQKQNSLISDQFSEDTFGDDKINEWNFLAKYNHQFNKKWNTQLELYTTEHHAYQTFNKNKDEESDFKHRMFRPEFRAYYKIKPKHHIIAGSGLTYERLDKNRFATNPTFSSPYAYLQYDGYLTPKTNFIVGARYDIHSKYSSQLSPKLAMKHKLNNNFGLRGSVGYGFKTPDFRKLYYDFTNSAVGYTVLGYNVIPEIIPKMNAAGLIDKILVPISHFQDNKLKPESSVAYNLGIDFKTKNGFSSSINFFRNDIKDLINVVTIARKNNGLFVYSYENVNKVYTQGVEFNTKYKWNDSFSFQGGYQLLYAYDKEAKEAFKKGIFAKDSQNISFKLKEKDYFGLYNRSRHMANFKVFYTNSNLGLDANFRVTYRSKYGQFDTNSNGYLDSYDNFIAGYTISDFAAHKTIFKNYKVGFGVDNIFDFTNPQNITNVPGRIIYGTININF